MSYLWKVPLVAGLLWGEFGGLAWAFIAHGATDAALAFFIPPFAWYRSVELAIYLIRLQLQ